MNIYDRGRSKKTLLEIVGTDLNAVDLTRQITFQKMKWQERFIGLTPNSWDNMASFCYCTYLMKVYMMNMGCNCQC